MAGYKVEICGVNTAALPLLKTEEKELLLKKIKNGDTQARERFINGNLRLVLSIVQRFSQSSENIDDLFQIGCVGGEGLICHGTPGADAIDECESLGREVAGL